MNAGLPVYTSVRIHPERPVCYVIFVGPETNAEFVPKCHMTPRACREPLPVLAT